MEPAEAEGLVADPELVVFEPVACPAAAVLEAVPEAVPFAVDDGVEDEDVLVASVGESAEKGTLALSAAA